MCTLQGIPLLIDNQRALDLIKSGQINDRTKYVNTRFRYICDCKKAGDIVGEHVTTDDQIVDIITKSLEMEKFSGF